MHSQLHERARVDQQLQSLTRGQLARLMLSLYTLLPPSQAYMRAPLLQLVDERAQDRGEGGLGGDD